jgi:hypothetical protein
MEYWRLKPGGSDDGEADVVYAYVNVKIDGVSSWDRRLLAGILANCADDAG